MKATKLRLGNYLQGKNTVVKVTRIFNEDEIGIGGGDPYIVSGENPCLLPIPLTEEWLLKCGFIKMTDTQPYNYRIHKSKMFFYIRYGTFTTDRGKTELIGFNGLFIANKFVRVIKYVHELQNLYFALTGEELNIEL